MPKDSLTPQQKAEQKRAIKRRGTATFSSVRFEHDPETKYRIDKIIELHGGTKKAALIAAFDALEKSLQISRQTS